MAPNLSLVRYVLDTDSVTFQQLGRPTIVARLAQHAPEEIATTAVTLYEQLRGRLAAINRQQPDADLQRAYQRLQATHDYYCRVQVLPFDAVAATMYRQLVAQGLRIGAQDLRIAAITLATGGTLVTSNRRHFDQVPGLHIEDWST
jgi:tRNA(fMet)-specific endonuclease VapC